MPEQPPCRILAAPTSDPTSERAVVEFAARLAGGLGAELLLLAIAPVAMPATGRQLPGATRERGHRVQEEQMRLDTAARERLESVTADVPAHVSVRALLGRGRPGPAIVRAAREHQPDLVIVGMRRAGRVGHALHDGVDRSVLHHSAGPVVVVPPETAAPHRAAAAAA